MQQLTSEPRVAASYGAKVSTEGMKGEEEAQKSTSTALISNWRSPNEQRKEMKDG